MNKITQYFDLLIDSIPVNKITKKIRMDILNSAGEDYEALLDQGLSKREARAKVIENLPDPTEFSEYIPNKHSLLYYAAILVVFAASVYGLYVMSNPDFLQLLKPTILEFPDILENLAHYTFICAAIYFIGDLIYPLLPQSLLNRNTIVSALILYAGIAFYALYAAIAFAFCWFTFNGFVEAELSSGFSAFMLSFYKIIIQNRVNTYIFGIITGLLLVSHKQRYHLSMSAKEYVPGCVYQPLFPTEKTYTEQVEEPIVQEDSFDAVIDNLRNEVDIDLQTEQTPEPEPILEETDIQEVEETPVIETVQETEEPQDFEQSQVVEEIQEIEELHEVEETVEEDISQIDVSPEDISPVDISLVDISQVDLRLEENESPEAKEVPIREVLMENLETMQEGTKEALPEIETLLEDVISDVEDTQIDTIEKEPKANPLEKVTSLFSSFFASKKSKEADEEELIEEVPQKVEDVLEELKEEATESFIEIPEVMQEVKQEEVEEVQSQPVDIINELSNVFENITEPKVEEEGLVKVDLRSLDNLIDQPESDDLLAVEPKSTPSSTDVLDSIEEIEAILKQPFED